MNTAEQITPASIKELLDATGPCITMVFHQSPRERKDAVNKVRSELTAKGIDPESLLEPITNRSAQGMEGAKNSIAIFRSPQVMLEVPVDSSIKPIVKVAERFDLRTLLSVSDGMRTFYLLALSQNRTRLLECTRHSSRELPFPTGFPTSLADSMQTRQPDHVLDGRSSGGPSNGSMKGVLFATSSDRESKDEYLLHFFIEIDKAVHTLLKGHDEPLIPVGVEHELALYKRVNTYGRLLETGVRGAPDGLDSGEMHRRAIALLESHPELATAELLMDFDKKVGSGHASIQMQEIVAAAYQGRVSHLFLQENAHYAGSYDAVRQRVKHSDDPLDHPVDLLESAALETMAHGGAAHLLQPSAMPNGVPACALFRYAAAIDSGPATASSGSA